MAENKENKKGIFGLFAKKQKEETKAEQKKEYLGENVLINVTVEDQVGKKTDMNLGAVELGTYYAHVNEDSNVYVCDGGDRSVLVGGKVRVSEGDQIMYGLPEYINKDVVLSNLENKDLKKSLVEKKKAGLELVKQGEIEKREKIRDKHVNAINISCDLDTYSIEKEFARKNKALDKVIADKGIEG